MGEVDDHALEPGQVDVRLAWIGTYVQTSHDDRDDVVGRGEIDIVHDQTLLLTEGRLGVDVGLPARFSGTVVVPFRLVSTGITYLDSDGAEVELTEPGIHHRDETVSGLGDPMVLAGRAWTIGDVGIATRLGLTLPLGRTESDPFVNAAVPHQHIQLGTGTFNPVASIDVARAFGPWRASVFAFTQQGLYENGKAYQSGDRYAGGVAVRRGLGAWTLRGGFEAQGETAERWGGVVHTDDGNQGRLDLMIAGGAQWAVTEALGLELALKVPVYSYVVGGQLDMPLIVEVGVSWGFGRKQEDDHEHEHEHDHDHDHEDGEHEDYGLEPVPGKVTVFDYWATWCKPCVELDALLRAEPGIEVRRIEVIDDHAPGEYDLPHIKVFDEHGTLVLERTGSPRELIDAIRTITEK